MGLEDAHFTVTPNPVMQWATIQLAFDGVKISGEWVAGIYDVAGRLVSALDAPVENGNGLQWEWNIDSGINAGIYFCKAQSEHGEVSTKIIVLPE